MKIILNGQEKEVTEDISLSELIHTFSAQNPRVIAEVNGAIVQVPDWNNVQIKNGDAVELIRFVGGG